MLDHRFSRDNSHVDSQGTINILSVHTKYNVDSTRLVYTITSLCPVEITLHNIIILCMGGNVSLGQKKGGNIFFVVVNFKEGRKGFTYKPILTKNKLS